MLDIIEWCSAECALAMNYGRRWRRPLPNIRRQPVNAPTKWIADQQGDRDGMTQTPLVTGTCNDEQSPAPLVEVAFARTRREARELCKLLQAEGIACAVEGPGTVPGRGLAVLADAGALVRASDLLSIRSLGEEDDDLDIDSDTDDLDDDVDDDLDDDDDD